MRAVDISHLVSVGRPTIAPDGSFAVFATSRPDLAANPATYPALLDWLAALHDPAVDTALATRPRS